ncbi:MAG: primosomal protein N' (replication factor Y) - superfamily II helicase [Pseudomonadota bacterium]
MVDLLVGPWGARRTDPEPTPTAPVDDEDGRFACTNCGAVLGFAPGTEQLTCSYCGHVNAIRASTATVEEQDLDAAFATLGDAPPPSEPVSTRCTGCGASFTFDPPLHAGPCRFCGTAVVAEPGGALAPDGLLPFLIGEATARERVDAWLKKLWFAPNHVAREARGRDALHGLYVPFFTYDSRTETSYRGQRGDVYHQTVMVPVVVNGRRTMQRQQVPKVRWRHAAGAVRRHFDDVLVPASTTLPAPLVQRLRRFDLHETRSFQDDFLAGFESERYQRSLADGFEDARAIMRNTIQGDIRADIGGDMQRIAAMDVRHADRSYKLVLLPVWRADLRFMGRVYRVLVNGRSGEIVGERPWSISKIAGAVVGVVAIVAAVMLTARAFGGGF